MMVNRSEAIVSVINKITCLKEEKDNYPCKKTLQKIVYLIEEAGENLGFDYSIHFYGPYSAELDYEIQDLNARGILDIKYTKHGHLLSIPQNINCDEIGSIADNIIKTFGLQTPFDLELLATALFVQREMYTNDKSSIINGVKKIKGSKYSNKHIENAIQLLRENNFFNIK